MCFGDSDRSGGRPQNNRRNIKRMDRLGYEIEGSVAGSHPLVQEQIALYPVQDFFNKRIAMLAASSGFLIVTQLYLDRDLRADETRPLASDVLLSFWKHAAQQPVSSLIGVIFQTVEEPSVQDARRHVYRRLRKDLGTPVRLRRGSGGAEKHEFDRVHDGTKLGRCVRTIAAEYIEMKEFGARIRQFEFIPQGPRGEDFHFVVTLEYGR